jgi:hypothetical protein
MWSIGHHGEFLSSYYTVGACLWCAYTQHRGNGSSFKEVIMVEIPGYTPSRRVEKTSEGYMIYVQPPKFMALPEVSVYLTADQFDRYAKWQSGVLTIHEALPELSISTHEMLISGLTDKDWDRITRDPDDV